MLKFPYIIKLRYLWNLNLWKKLFSNLLLSVSSLKIEWRHQQAAKNASMRKRDPNVVSNEKYSFQTKNIRFKRKICRNEPFSFSDARIVWDSLFLQKPFFRKFIVTPITRCIRRWKNGLRGLLKHVKLGWVLESNKKINNWTLFLFLSVFQKSGKKQ